MQRKIEGKTALITGGSNVVKKHSISSELPQKMRIEATRNSENGVRLGDFDPPAAFSTKAARSSPGK